MRWIILVIFALVSLSVYSKPFIGIGIGKTECDFSYCRDSHNNYAVLVGYSFNKFIDVKLDATRTDLDSNYLDEVRTDIINLYPRVNYKYDNFVFYYGMGFALVKQDSDDFRAISVNIGAKYITNDYIDFFIGYDLLSNIDGKYNINDVALFKLGLEYKL